MSKKRREKPAGEPSSGRSESESFCSILFPTPKDPLSRESREEPAFFRDLNLDQVVADVTAARKDYDLSPLFHVPLDDLGEIVCRQDVIRDLEDESLKRVVESFSERMRSMRRYLGQAAKSHYKFEKKRWFLDAADLYCGACERLEEDLGRSRLASRGWRSFREYMADYVGSASFGRLASETRTLKADLYAVTYALLIRGGSVTVRHYAGETDYSAAIEKTFEKFRKGAAVDYRVDFKDLAGLNHVEAEILDRVARLHPEPFSALDAFDGEHADFVDGKIARFDREVQFCAAYLAYIDRLRQAGLQFCYPRLARSSKEIDVRATFDLALASRLVGESKTVVCNDLCLRGPERVFVVSGPNQGGKTTFARTVGQLHYLARLGCPVPGADARLFLCDRIYTHFEREEDFENLRGKLQSDLTRIRQILDQATPNSLLIINEIFLSTALRDAVFLSQKVMAKISDLDALGVWVTFLTELASFNNKTVSVVSSVDPRDHSVRTFKIERKPADGLAYALAISEKHRLTYVQLKERIPG